MPDLMIGIHTNKLRIRKNIKQLILIVHEIIPAVTSTSMEDERRKKWFERIRKSVSPLLIHSFFSSIDRFTYTPLLLYLGVNKSIPSQSKSTSLCSDTLHISLLECYKRYQKKILDEEHKIRKESKICIKNKKKGKHVINYGLYVVNMWCAFIQTKKMNRSNE